jgi:hypothetical protein
MEVDDKHIHKFRVKFFFYINSCTYHSGANRLDYI